MTCAVEISGARETELDGFCSSDAGAIDAAEGGPAHSAGGVVYPRCIIWLVAFVCWSLHRLCERVESHGRRGLLCLSTFTPIRSRRGLCVRACNHRPQQHQHQTTISSAVASSPCIRAPGACLQQRANPVLAVGRTYFPSSFAHKYK